MGLKIWWSGGSIFFSNLPGVGRFLMFDQNLKEIPWAGRCSFWVIIPKYWDFFFQKCLALHVLSKSLYNCPVSHVLCQSLWKCLVLLVLCPSLPQSLPSLARSVPESQSSLSNSYPAGCEWWNDEMQWSKFWVRIFWNFNMGKDSP